MENSFQIFEALGDHRSKASVLESLGELYLATGDLRKSHQLAEQSLQEISQFQNAGMKIFYLFRSGLVLMEMDDPSSAYRRFLEAHQLSADQNIPVRIAEIAGYLAACAVMLGQLDEARKFAHETWDYLTKEGWFGMVDPLKTYRILSETFDALGEAENAHIALEKGYQVLMKLADSITEPAWRKSFLENNPDARAILEMWERRKSAE